MTEQTMIERVARALCRHDGHGENIRMDGRPMWVSYVPEARAEVAAMCEPTKGMRLAAAEKLDRNPSPIRPSGPLYWAVMIDAALAEER
ncbi:hypothetical protein [Sphingomonas nostoxanthinifaciens]|uniref:hypothetical protein n=1 Tax=Sphingomonas nostoxanthinifaciens TaxID=2872652 RepID=UPI001CC21454|nr:hypothetical protein [Sphingomonas nostoxanthinifaciens]UAK25679.1 hypothetical protein K8P63_05940 [Sphingomonas nostoxanthinifaciens]